MKHMICDAVQPCDAAVVARRHAACRIYKRLPKILVSNRRADCARPARRGRWIAMKAPLVAVALVAISAICSLLGFWIGFRQGWHLGYAVQVAPNAAAELQLGRRLDDGHADEVHYYFESQVDGALMYWHDVLDSPVSPYFNSLTGGKFFPEYETYIRSLAQYRKAHPSPLWDPRDMADVDEYLAKHKPKQAAEFAAASREAKATMDEVVSKYAP